VAKEADARGEIPIKALLLDQGALAGIGNWIADEVLYAAVWRRVLAAASSWLSHVRLDDCSESGEPAAPRTLGRVEAATQSCRLARPSDD
jgi:hypothetical protein